ncbi:MAG: hypothetical protein DRJ38_02895 [Thermoprotei archaeon]|nr:MAG: hypothetical protein DRJ38_02895 [Thermoprotei archaeon]
MTDEGNLWIKQRYFPGRRITIVSIRLKAKPNFLVKPVEVFSKCNIGILSCIIQAHPDRPFVRATIFLDLTYSTISREEIVSKIMSLPGVREIELLESPLTHGEARLVAFTLGEIQDLFGMLRNLGSGGKAILFNMGYRAGYNLADRIAKFFKSSERALEYMMLYHESLGHGRFEILKYIDEVECIIRADELCECMGVKAKEPNSHLFRGILTGILSRLWKNKVLVEEVKCVAKGDDHCEFKVEVSR